MNIYIIRHGETAGNVFKKYVGRTDEPLSDIGIEYVKKSGISPGVKKVYVSPMLRVKMTASIKFPNAAQIVMDGLREFDFGDFEYRSAGEMADDPAYREWVDGYCAGTPPGGEDRERFSQRVRLAFERIVGLSAGDGNVFIVAHGGTIMSIMDRYAVPEKPYFEWFTANCGGYRARLILSEQNAITLTDYEPI